MDKIGEFLVEVGGIALIIIGCLVVVIVLIAMVDRHERPKQDQSSDEVADAVAKGESSSEPDDDQSSGGSGDADIPSEDDLL